MLVGFSYNCWLGSVTIILLVEFSYNYWKGSVAIVGVVQLQYGWVQLQLLVGFSYNMRVFSYNMVGFSYICQLQLHSMVKVQVQLQYFKKKSITTLKKIMTYLIKGQLQLYRLDIATLFYKGKLNVPLLMIFRNGFTRIHAFYFHPAPSLHKSSARCVSLFL